MARIKGGQIQLISGSNSLADERIYTIIPDDLGFFWISSARGIARISRRSMNDYADGKSTTLVPERFEGLESVKFSDRTDQGYTGCKTPDGRIWFPSPQGVVIINPAHFFTNQVPPPVHINEVRVNGVDLTTRRAAVLETTGVRVEFSFAALSYIAPKKVDVRYQLVGVDPGWIKTGGRRSVLYSNLPAGHYRFRVRAGNADGVWNTAGDEYAIELPQLFYQTVWFYCLAGLAAGLGSCGAFRWKVGHLRMRQRQLQNEKEQLEAKVSKRTGELASSLALLKATLNSTADGILAIQLSDRALSFNRQFAEMWRLPPRLASTASYLELRAFIATQVTDPVLHAAGVENVFSQPEAETFNIAEMKDGRLFERYVKPQRIDGKCVGVVINYRDITDRKRAEAAVAEPSSLLEVLLENSVDYIYFKDRQSRFVRYSKTMLRYFHLTDPDALMGKTDFDGHPEARARRAYADKQEILRSGQPLVGKLEMESGPKGRTVWILTTKMPWRNLHGAIIGTFGVSRDVSAIKEAEVLLAYERDLLKTLMDTSPDQIYFKDRESRFIRTSKAQAENFRMPSPDALLGKTDFDFFTREHAQPAFDDEQEIIRSGRALIGKIEKETWHDGRESWLLTSKIPLRNSSGEIIGTVGISKDITSLKQAEAELARVHRQLLDASRQAGMAEVATSVLHNVGNVLNSVNVSATLVADIVHDSKAVNLAKACTLLDQHQADLGNFLVADPKGRIIPAYLGSLAKSLADERKAVIAEVENLRMNIEHIKDIVGMQQNHAKTPGFEETVVLTELIEDALRMNSGLSARHDVKLLRDYQVSPVLTLDKHKVIQILINLLRNAKYACDESASIAKLITVRTTAGDRTVLIAVIDNGVGIPAENLTRIFEYGFTTRQEGHGFGLHSGALAARELGGSLSVCSEGPGSGATFILELPAPPENPPHAKSAD